jgi:hypothetical protein
VEMNSHLITLKSEKEDWRRLYVEELGNTCGDMMVVIGDHEK